MNLDRERRLVELLLGALDRPKDQQRSYLEAASDGDDGLLRDALECLALEEDTGDFLAEPALARMRSRTGKTVPDRPVDRSFEEIRNEASSVEVIDEEEIEPPPELDRDELGGYRILGHLGTGGMSQIYMGEDMRLGRRVAIKILAPETAERPGWLTRFEREARTLAALNHPNIVTIHSVEEDDGIRFLTMELVEGKTLKEILPPNGLPLDEVLRIATELTDALVAAHERGVIHRDLKPSNVMITGDGRVKILDFGIAKVSGQRRSTGSHDGMVIGTVPYMAPEQARGESVDPRSDIFTLGILFYQMVTGEHPFPAQGSTFKRLAAILDHEPTEIGLLRDDVPEALIEIIDRCLEKEADVRFQSARQLAEVLRKVRDDQLAEKLLESRTDLQPLRISTREKARRYRPLLLVAVFLAILVVLGLAIRGCRSREGGVSGVAPPAAPIHPSPGATVDLRDAASA